MNDAVGISKSDCECFIKGLSAEKIEAMRRSTSELYLDQFPGSALALLPKTGQCGDIATLALESRAYALKRMEDDMIIKLNEKYTKDKQKYSGGIGKMDYTDNLSRTGNIQGIRLRPVDHIDAVIMLKKLHVVLNQSLLFNVKLIRVPYDSVMGEIVQTWNVQTVANAYTLVTSEPIRMNFIHNNRLVEYYLLYDLAASTAVPKNTNVKCGHCPGNGGYEKFISVNGVQLNNIETLNDKVLDTYSRGLILDVDISCDNSSFICNQYQNNDSVQLVMNHMLGYKANEMMVRQLLNSPEVNRFTMMDRPQLMANAAIFNNSYDSRMDKFLIPSLNVNESGCFECKPAANEPYLALLT